MTKEELMKVLKDWKPELELMAKYNDNSIDYQRYSALESAIKVLEHEPKFILKSDGTIEQITNIEVKTMKPDVAQRLQNFLYRRLYESALNNVGYKCNAEDVFMDIADNRLKTWLHDFYDMERGHNEKIL